MSDMGDILKKKGRGIARTLKNEGTDNSNDNSYDKIDPSELKAQKKKRVTYAEIWECPLQNASLQAFGLVHQGIVLTMENGNKYIVHKSPSENDDGSEKDDGSANVVVSKAANMGKNWSLVKGKDVRTAKLGDYLEKCGDRYDTVNDNCLHAVARMWSLE